MAMTDAQRQAARRERLKGLQVTVMLTQDAKDALDELVESGMTKGEAISKALLKLTTLERDSNHGNLAPMKSTKVTVIKIL